MVPLHGTTVRRPIAVVIGTALVGYSRVVIATVLALAAVIAGTLVRSRSRRRPRIDGQAAERAVRARIEQASAQNRATQFHPDLVRSWMRMH